MSMTRRFFAKMMGAAPIAGVAMGREVAARGVAMPSAALSGMGLPLSAQSGPKESRPLSPEDKLRQLAEMGYERFKSQQTRNNRLFMTGVQVGADIRAESMRSWSPAFRRIYVIQEGEKVENTIHGFWQRLGVKVPRWLDPPVEDDHEDAKP